ncbi:hypothetical protein HMPREF1127_1752 [Fusobacterium necrophorum subsp. funduliforme Fnf 1007]|uniref:Uncharacterized protein n=1 Tax=Fusobacterium necrophorum subsp. funduliforme Fnf 1007 TaxID=1161424 RepID=A0AAN3VXV4_9FUSO|nr:hypothetical protein HMPREF1127_1752 [Fusobacterium necrophorum subsp. funduliforme Fnf 1007]
MGSSFTKSIRKAILILSKETKTGIDYFMNINFQELIEWTEDLVEILEKQAK